MIDQALVDFGMPMGPVELADQIGLDVTHDASLSLGMTAEVAAVLKAKIDAGDLGRKSGHGFYEWDEKRRSGRGLLMTAKNLLFLLPIFSPP